MLHNPCVISPHNHNDAFEGDVLKFQNFHSSWKNVSHNLAASGAVLGSTGLRQSAANDQMGDRGVAEASIEERGAGGQWRPLLANFSLILA